MASLSPEVYLPTYPLSPWERARERAKRETVSQFRRQTRATAVFIKPALPVFRRPKLCHERKLKRSSVGYAHDHTASNTTRSSENTASTKLKRMQRVLLKPKYRFQTTVEAKSQAKPTLQLNHFWLLCHLEFPRQLIPLSPRERARERAQHKPESQFRGQSPRYDSCYKTRFARFQTT